MGKKRFSTWNTTCKFGNVISHINALVQTIKTTKILEQYKVDCL